MSFSVLEDLSFTDGEYHFTQVEFSPYDDLKIIEWIVNLIKSSPYTVLVNCGSSYFHNMLKNRGAIYEQYDENSQNNHRGCVFGLLIELQTPHTYGIIYRQSISFTRNGQLKNEQINIEKLEKIQSKTTCYFKNK